MTEEIFLEVPYSQKDEVKTLGAKWNHQLKKWVALKSQMVKFTKWLPVPDPEPDMELIPPVYLLQSYEKCWKCKEITPVYALAAHGVNSEKNTLDIFLTFFNLRIVQPQIKKILLKNAPSYYLDYSRQANSKYYLNHCQCGAKQGDFFMHSEPNGPFFPTSKPEAERIKIGVVSVEPIKIDGEFSAKSDDLILNYASKYHYEL